MNAINVIKKHSRTTGGDNMKTAIISFITGFITAFVWVRYVVKQTFGPLVEKGKRI
jgi:hypothetical protein